MGSDWQMRCTSRRFAPQKSTSRLRTGATRMLCLTAWMFALSAWSFGGMNHRLLANAQRSVCRDGSTGYDSIDDLSASIEAEVSRIVNGGRPHSVYVYRFCPGSVMQLRPGQSVRPKLDGSIFQCGDGTKDNQCTISGGSDQVIIDRIEELANVFPATDIRFVGFTFTDFTNSVISGNASASSTVTIESSVISDAVSRYVINQSRNGAAKMDGGGREPFTFNLFASTIRNLRGGVMISSEGGHAILQDVALENLEFMAAGAVGKGGVMMLSDVSIMGGVYENGLIAMQGAKIRADGLNVSGLDDLQGCVLIAEGVGSEIHVSSSTVVSNDLRDTSSTWTALRANDGASISVLNTHFSDNYQMRSVLSADGGSHVVVDQVTVSAAAGTDLIDTLVSSVVTIDEGSSAVIRRFVIEDVIQFTTSIFANGNSSLQLAQSCLSSGQTQGAVYISEDSSYRVSRNYISDEAYRTLDDPTACPVRGSRLIRERPGSQCFKGSLCLTECRSLGDESFCLAQFTLSPTEAPTPMTASLSQATTRPSFSQPDGATGVPTPALGSIGTLVPSVVTTSFPTPSSGTFAPTSQPTPTSGTFAPTSTISPAPSPSPTASPKPTVSFQPSQPPTISSMPSAAPSEQPSSPPTASPMPSAVPSAPPSTATESPSAVPSSSPTLRPSASPSVSSVPSVEPSVTPTLMPSSRPSSQASPHPSSQPTFLQRTAEPSACNKQKPNCDCRKYWYGSGQYASPGYAQGYGYAYGGYYDTSTNDYYGMPKSKKGSEGSKGLRERQLPYYTSGGYGHRYGYVQYSYDPCYYYCQWVLHNAYANNRPYGNGNYRGR